MRGAGMASVVILFLPACVDDAQTLSPDASAVTDAASSAADAADSAPSPTTFCAAHTAAAFCEDFDRGATAPWSFSVSSQALGAPVANDAAFTSPPRAAAFHLAAATHVFEGTYLAANVAASGAKGAKLSLSFRFDQANPGAENRDFFIVRTDGVNGIALHRAATAAAESWSIGPDFSPIDTIPLHTWVAMVLDVTFDTPSGGSDGGVGGGTFTLGIANKSFGPFPAHGAALTPSSTVGALLGSQVTTATSQIIDFSIDDVVLEVTR